ncbi:2-hydroxyacid dehydrogenase [Spirulina sp. 06S082]|uniref:2-hydroxyacid dehydrogenase n=1 Tax=Spirulina sp. 06S082 TaxID=3110248 RepID=UPI002B214A83|nr:2-hydroxyacid dehydrogenase [Spirulina sp. 06S082]MEA5470345.1 2-hydroxyacid dehydrogenase [Spirulina sp. 06S082]
MRVAIFSTKPYDRQFFEAANCDGKHEFVFFETPLNRETAPLAREFPAVCVFVNDNLNAATLLTLSEGDTRLIALRCAGYNNIDLTIARELGFTITRVPAYSPYAVAEHTIGLMLALNRRIHRAYNRVRNGNFALSGMLGFDMRDRTAAVIGTGKIGALTANLLNAFGCHLVGYDVYENPDCIALGMEYLSLEKALSVADIITLHCPLLPSTHHIIDDRAIACMKKGVMLINTSRGGLIDTQAVIRGLKSEQVGYLGMDVYEKEQKLFFEDLSDVVMQDDDFGRLLTFPNVLITGHQAFFTREAMTEIAHTTLINLNDFEANRPCANNLDLEKLAVIP